MDTHLPKPESVDRIVGWYRQGLSVAEAKYQYRKCQGGYRGGDALVVERVYREPDRYDTYIDPVAIARAFNGDRTVWDAMTYYEQNHLITLVAKRAVAGKTHPRWPGNPPYLEKAKESAARGCALQGWLVLLAGELGIQSSSFRNAADQVRKGNRRYDE